MNSMHCWGWVTGDKSAGCPGCQKDQPQPGVHPAQHCQLIVHSALHWWGLEHWGSLGSLSAGRTSDCYSALEPPVWPKLQKVSRTKPEEQLRTLGWVEFGGKRAEGCPHHSLHLPLGEEEMLIPLWWPARGHEEIEWGCTEGSSDWTPGKGSSLREWLVTGPVTQGSGQGTKPVRVWASPGFHSQPQSLMLGSWTWWSLWIPSYLSYAMIPAISGDKRCVMY